MPDLQGMIDTSSSSFWSLMLAIVVVALSFVAARWVRRRVRRGLREFEGLDEYAGATLGRVAGWVIVLLGVVLGIARTSKRLFPRLVGWAYVGFIRNIPPVPFLFLFYFPPSISCILLFILTFFLSPFPSSIIPIYSFLYFPNTFLT